MEFGHGGFGASSSPYWGAAVCTEGHVYGYLIGSPRGPQGQVPKYCGECGASIVTTCPSCSEPVHGWRRDGFGARVGWQPDDFCPSCAQPFAWASDRARRRYLVRAIREDETLTPDARARLLREIEPLISTSAPTEDLATQTRLIDRVRKLAPVAFDRAWPIFGALISAELKAKMGLPPA
ncbi:MAG: DUF2321 domain-containing protein [Candidatus Dormibacteria bacterium]